MNKQIKLLMKENNILKEKLEKCKIFVPPSLLSGSETKNMKTWLLAAKVMKKSKYFEILLYEYSN